MEGLIGYHTIAQAAALLGITEGGVRHLIAKGGLATTSLPGTKRPRLIPQAEIDRYQRERQPRGRPRATPQQASR